MQQKMGSDPRSEFLLQAKLQTYASSGEGGERILADGSKELIWEDGDYKYRDSYFGYNPFIGEEIVWQNSKAIWGMNYYGQIVSDQVLAKDIYRFLQTALRLIEIEKPFRGPDYFQEGDWEYQNTTPGAVDKFEGLEVIYFQKEKVYELKYQGGLIIR
jgi:hypothetical protein